MKFLVADKCRPDTSPDEPAEPDRVAGLFNARRADLHQILALIILATALTALLSGIRAEYLAHLPGLGPKSAPKSRERGCLTKTQRQNLAGLVIEPCDPNSP